MASNMVDLSLDWMIQRESVPRISMGKSFHSRGSIGLYCLQYIHPLSERSVGKVVWVLVVCKLQDCCELGYLSIADETACN